jgi:hypothetical protein
MYKLQLRQQLKTTNPTIESNAVQVLRFGNVCGNFDIATNQRLSENVLHNDLKPWIVLQLTNHWYSILHKNTKTIDK